MLTDPELRELAEAELEDLKSRIPSLEHEIRLALLPRDEADERSAILEVRPAAGGDEAALFAALAQIDGRITELDGLDGRRAAVDADLAAATGVRGTPLDARVTRWGGALPQYTVGHLDRVAAIHASVATQPGLAVCGAAYDGIGIPACIATAATAAAQIATHLLDRRPAHQPG
jgi:hypothetical protein